MWEKLKNITVGQMFVFVIIVLTILVGIRFVLHLDSAVESVASIERNMQKCVAAVESETADVGMPEAGDRDVPSQFATVEKQKSICADWSGTAYVVGGRSVLCVFGAMEMRRGKLDAVRARCESGGGKFLGSEYWPFCDLSEVK